MLRTSIVVLFLILIIPFPAFADVNSELILAAGKGDIDRVQALLDMNAAVDASDKYGVTPLMVAASNGHIDIVSLLLRKGARVDLKANNGFTALSAAEKKGYKKIVELLGRAEDNKLGFIDKEKNEDLMKTPYQTEPKLKSENFPTWDKIYHYFSFRESQAFPFAIVLAALILVIGQLIVVRYKIKNQSGRGVDVGTKDNEGRTPLMYAAMNGHNDIVKMLLDEGADMNARSKDGKTALSLAAMGKHNETVKILLTGVTKGKQQNKAVKTTPMLAGEGYKNVHLFKKIKAVD